MTIKQAVRYAKTGYFYLPALAKLVKVAPGINILPLLRLVAPEGAK